MKSKHLSRQFTLVSAGLLSALFFASSVLAAEGQKASPAPNGMKCTKQHAGTVHPCMPNNPNPARATLWSKVTDGAYKSCEPSSNAGDNCVELPRASHTIMLYTNNTCTGPATQTINVDQKRCD